MAQEEEPRGPERDAEQPTETRLREGDAVQAEPAEAPPREPEVATARLKQELEQAQDRALRLTAELENVQRRARKQLDDELRYANLPLMRDLLPVLDNLTRALEAAEKTHDAKSLLEGVQMSSQQLRDVLARHHCHPIEALHQPFDPHKHEALMQQPTADQPPGTVVAIAQPGYQLHERVIRPTQVIVSSSADEGE